MTGHLHADDNVYDSLAEAAGGEGRWAFGTGFVDPLAGMDTAVPPGVDAFALARRCLGLGDDALVMAQRLAAWCSNAHELEDEVALANIALDLLGQGRLLLTRAAQADPSLRPPQAPAHVPDEDALAYFRGSAEFGNVRLVELDDSGDFARCVARLFAFVTWRLAVLTRLANATDPLLAAIAAKGAVECAYHREYAAGWLVRLGDGTAVSHERMQAATDWIWPYLDELFDDDHDTDTDTDSGADVRAEFDEVVRSALGTATLDLPALFRAAPGERGRDGTHTDALDSLLADLQSVARAHPDATW
jgi:ring-1,2-phenylacetyl-CoA epoxidase subunit PaaC